MGGFRPQGRAEGRGYGGNRRRGADGAEVEKIERQKQTISSWIDLAPPEMFHLTEKRAERGRRLTTCLPLLLLSEFVLKNAGGEAERAMDDNLLSDNLQQFTCSRRDYIKHFDLIHLQPFEQHEINVHQPQEKNRRM